MPPPELDQETFFLAPLLASFSSCCAICHATNTVASDCMPSESGKGSNAPVSFPEVTAPWPTSLPGASTLPRSGWTWASLQMPGGTNSIGPGKGFSCTDVGRTSLIPQPSTPTHSAKTCVRIAPTSLQVILLYFHVRRVKSAGPEMGNGSGQMTSTK